MNLNILVLRPSDRDLTVSMTPFDQVGPADFTTPAKLFDEADAVLYIEGCRTRFLKDKFGKSGKLPCPYRPSSFSAPRHDVRVVDGLLFCTFHADEKLGIEAGTLICQPWTPEDYGVTSAEDDVLGVTVSREDAKGTWRKFHDIGFFIPDYTSPDGL